MNRMVILAGAAACLLASSGALQAQTFSFQTIDNPADPTFNQLLGINDSSVISGYFGSGAAGHPNKGYLTSPPYSAFVSLNSPGSVQTQATGLNNSGQVGGFWSDTNLGSGDNNFGFLAEPIGSNYQFITVNDPNVGGTPLVTQALGVNNKNIVGGFYVDAGGVSHGFTYNLTTAAYTSVNVGNAASTAVTGVNDNNQVCGFFTTAKGATLGFVRNSTGGVVTHFKVPGTNLTQLLGINNSAVAVGFYMKGGITHGLYYVPSTGNWLTVDDPNGTQGTVVNGINNKGQLVGFYTDAAGNTHGMLVTVNP